jgi:hypothetical protein
VAESNQWLLGARSEEEGKREITKRNKEIWEAYGYYHDLNCGGSFPGGNIYLYPDI